jgi:hypothetical protein
MITQSPARYDDGPVTASLAPLADRTELLVPGSVDSYLVTDVPLCGPDMPMTELHAMLIGRPYESTAAVRCARSTTPRRTGCSG